MVLHYIFILAFMVALFNYFRYLHKTNKYVKMKADNEACLTVNKKIEQMFMLNLEVHEAKEQLQIYSLIAIVCLYLEQ